MSDKGRPRRFVLIGVGVALIALAAYLHETGQLQGHLLQKGLVFVGSSLVWAGLPKAAKAIFLTVVFLLSTLYLLGDVVAEGRAVDVVLMTVCFSMFLVMLVASIRSVPRTPGSQKGGGS